MTKETIISAIALVIAIVGMFFPQQATVAVDELGNKTASFWTR
jgi:hypothetical protein